MRTRLADLEVERRTMLAPPVVRGGCLVVPAGLLARRMGREATPGDWSADAEARRRMELCAMATVMGAERDLLREPRDVSKDNVG